MRAWFGVVGCARASLLQAEGQSGWFYRCARAVAACLLAVAPQTGAQLCWRTATVSLAFAIFSIIRQPAAAPLPFNAPPYGPRLSPAQSVAACLAGIGAAELAAVLVVHLLWGATVAGLLAALVFLWITNAVVCGAENLARRGIPHVVLDSLLIVGLPSMMVLGSSLVGGRGDWSAYAPLIAVVAAMSTLEHEIDPNIRWATILGIPRLATRCHALAAVRIAVLSAVGAAGALLALPQPAASVAYASVATSLGVLTFFLAAWGLPRPGRYAVVVVMGSVVSAGNAVHALGTYERLSLCWIAGMGVLLALAALRFAAIGDRGLVGCQRGRAVV